MVLAEFVKFKHGLYKPCAIGWFEAIMLEPRLLQPCFHLAGGPPWRPPTRVDVPLWHAAAVYMYMYMYMYTVMCMCMYVHMYVYMHMYMYVAAYYAYE